MQKKIYILSLVTALLFLACKKEEPADDNSNQTEDTTNTEPTNKIFSAQVILTILDSNSNPLDSVGCILPDHEPSSAYTPYYTNTAGELTRSVWYKSQFGGLPDSQYVSLSKGALADTLYIPLAGDGSQNYQTHILQ